MLQKKNGTPTKSYPFFVTQERLRRAQGARITPANLDRYFTAQYYRSPDLFGSEYGTYTDAPADEITSPSGLFLKIGVLLPLTGQYSAHGIRVKQGIELAARNPNTAIRPEIVFRDTEGDPVKAVDAYKELVSEERVDIVVGPLLYKTSEEVGKESLGTGIPIISFTKRSGLPQIGETVFRLGLTASGQAHELAGYASRELQARSFAIAFPSSMTGREFSQTFGTEVTKQGGRDCCTSGLRERRSYLN